jgi:glucan biosynthesis protein C
MVHSNDSTVHTASVARTGRKYDIDHLRIFAILSVFFLHSAKIFDFHTEVVANDTPSAVLSAVRDFILLWVMPLFFVISGGTVSWSGSSRSAGAFIKAKLLRLVVPLLIVGTFVINPVYVYIERLWAGAADVGFFQWYPQFFSGVYGLGGNFAALGHGTHLWYLEFLFVYSLILLPLFLQSKKGGASWVTRLSLRLDSPWRLFFLFVPVSVSAVCFEMAGLGGVRGMGGWDPLSYFLFLFLGYLIFQSENTAATIKRYSAVYLAAAVVLTLFFIDSHFGFVLKIPGLHRHDLLNNNALLPLNKGLWTLIQALRGVIAWCWILGLLGLFQRIRMLNADSRFLSYAGEAVLPFYILHHAVIYVAGFYILQLHLGAHIKFVLIMMIAFAVIMILYETVIRRFNALRILFGMKRGKRLVPGRS